MESARDAFRVTIGKPRLNPYVFLKTSIKNKMIYSSFFLFSLLAFVFILSALPVVNVSLIYAFNGIEQWNASILGLSIPLNDFVMGLFIISVMLRFYLARERLNHELIQPLCWFAVAGFISTLFCMHPVQSFFNALHSGLYVLTALGLCHILSSKRRVLWAYSAASLSIFLTILLFIFQSGYSLNDPGGGYMDRNFIPVTIALISPFLLAASKYVNRAWKENGLALIFYCIFIVGLAVKSRSGVLILCVLYLLLFFFGLLHKKHAAWLAPFFVIGLFYGIVSFLNGSLTPKVAHWFESQGLRERIFNMYWSFSVFSDNPFFGVGTGLYESYYHWLDAGSIITASPRFSSFMVILVERGLPGILTLSWIFLTLSRRIRIRYSNSDDDEMRRAAIVSLILLLFASLLHSIHCYLFTWCWVALLFQTPRLYCTVKKHH